jgi:Stress responsive A/B Barrel Domain
MIRRIVLWAWNQDATPEKRLRSKEGLAYIRFAGHVDDLDFGEHLRSGLGRGRAFDLAMARDHVDRASWDAYVDDPHHFRVGNYIDTITHMDLTARIDYLYAGPPSRRGLIRHIGLYRWRDGVGQADRDRVREALAGVHGEHVVGLACGEDLGLGKNHHDWVVEAHVADLSALQAYLAHPVHRLLDDLTQAEHTAHLQHRMLSG